MQLAPPSPSAVQVLRDYVGHDGIAPRSPVLDGALRAGGTPDPDVGAEIRGDAHPPAD